MGGRPQLDRSTSQQSVSITGQNAPESAIVPNELEELRRWAAEVKAQEEITRLRAVKAAYAAGDTSALGMLELNSKGQLESKKSAERPHLPAAKPPTVFASKDRTEYNAWVQDCEDTFHRSPNHFFTDDAKITFAKQYLNQANKEVWAKHCETLKGVYKDGRHFTWEDLKSRMLRCLGTPLQRTMRASTLIKDAIQKGNQSPGDLMVYLRPL